MLKPLNIKVLVKPDGKKTETASGLYTGNYSIEKGLRRATVISIGDEVRDLKPGDRVCYSVEFGRPVHHNNEEYRLLYETEIIGWLENE